jgi:cell division protein FtsB
MTMRAFIAKIDAYNARVNAAEQQLRALDTEREILRAQASDYMRLSQFDAEIARFTFPNFTFPDGFNPEPAQQPADKAAE